MALAGVPVASPLQLSLPTAHRRLTVHGRPHWAALLLLLRKTLWLRPRGRTASIAPLPVARLLRGAPCLLLIPLARLLPPLPELLPRLLLVLPRLLRPALLLLPLLRLLRWLLLLLLPRWGRAKGRRAAAAAAAAAAATATALLHALVRRAATGSIAPRAPLLLRRPGRVAARRQRRRRRHVRLLQACMRTQRRITPQRRVHHGPGCASTSKRGAFGKPVQSDATRCYASVAASCQCRPWSRTQGLDF